MKPDYKVMSQTELREYIFKNRDDLDAIESFFERRTPDAESTIFPYADTYQEWQTYEQSAKQILESKFDKTKE